MRPRYPYAKEFNWLLPENQEINRRKQVICHEFGFGNGFLHAPSKTQAKEKENIDVTFTLSKTFVFLRTLSKQWKDSHAVEKVDMPRSRK